MNYINRNLNINYIKYKYKLISNFIDVIVNLKNYNQYKT